MGSSGMTATSSVEGPEPLLQRLPTTFTRPRSYPPRRHHTQPLPGPCHLGGLTHGSPHRRGCFSSSRVAPPLGNQSTPSVHSPCHTVENCQFPEGLTHTSASPAARKEENRPFPYLQLLGRRPIIPDIKNKYGAPVVTQRVKNLT